MVLESDLVFDGNQERAPYLAPEIVNYGDVVDLTATITGGSVDDGNGATAYTS